MTAVTAALAEGLFVAMLHSTYTPDGRPGTARRAAFGELKAYGVDRCAAEVAGEYGANPVEAAARMTAARTLVGAR